MSCFLFLLVKYLLKMVRQLSKIYTYIKNRQSVSRVRESLLIIDFPLILKELSAKSAYLIYYVLEKYTVIIKARKEERNWRCSSNKYSFWMIRLTQQIYARFSLCHFVLTGICKEIDFLDWLNTDFNCVPVAFHKLN